MSGAGLRDRAIIDGAHGEGGGQILRTAVSLFAITGRPLRVERIRALRRNPGLAAQHLTAVRAAAALCAAQLSGDTLGSTCLDFAPQAPVASGNYVFDVSLAREGGSAGAVMMVLQTVLLPLAFAEGDSEVALHGGTHMAWSPPFDYVRDVWLPVLSRLGVEASVAANLPAHIPQRMADRARSFLAVLGAGLLIEPLRVRAACPGAGIFLTAEYADLNCGFSAIGAVGKPSEQVAEEAAGALLDHHASGAALDRHLGDQILLPLCFSRGPSRFSVQEITRHLETNAWVIELFGVARVVSERGPSGTGLVSLTPTR